MNTTIELLDHWLTRRLDADLLAWLTDRLGQLDAQRAVDITLGMIPRRLGRADLALSQEETDAAAALQAGWDPANWTIDALARTRVLAGLHQQDPEAFPDRFTRLLQTADLNESIAYYQASALFPHDARLDAQLGEGLRSNVKAVFEAIAHGNPYPARHFGQNAWNHVVLKALFIDSALHPIVDLDRRANDELAGVLCDYAHERWAADRAISPEVWRLVGPFSSDTRRFDDLARVVESPHAVERAAALLALHDSPHPDAAALLNRHSDAHRQLSAQGIDWQCIAIARHQHDF